MQAFSLGWNRLLLPAVKPQENVYTGRQTETLTTQIIASDPILPSSGLSKFSKARWLRGSGINTQTKWNAHALSRISQTVAYHRCLCPSSHMGSKRWCHASSHHLLSSSSDVLPHCYPGSDSLLEDSWNRMTLLLSAKWQEIGHSEFSVEYRNLSIYANKVH